MVDIDKWTNQIPALHKHYMEAGPFPHIVMDDFLDNQIADTLLGVFPDTFFDKGWIHWKHFNENKHGLNNPSLIPTEINEFIQFMNSDIFVDFLEKVTGIADLIPDPKLEGAGLHIAERGGYLNIHADFSTHPGDADLKRRLNVLIYLNKDWQDTYKGGLELWSADMKNCAKKIQPIFNRLVIFNTTETSFHGFPDPIQCPENVTRKSIALYFYNKTKAEGPVVSTLYKTRPGDGIKALPNWIDNQLLFAYTYLKRKLKIKDDQASRLLSIKGWWGGKKRK